VNYVPGYQSYRSDMSSINHNISSRGRSVGSSGSEILVLLDGQRLNNDWSGGAGQVDNLVSLENVERVEFIRGPGSAIYGSNATTGVINIITRSLREVVVDAGSNKARHSSAQWHVEGSAGKLDIYANHAQSGGEALTLFNPTTRTEITSRDPYRADDAYLRWALGEFSLASRVASRDAEQFYSVGFTDKGNTSTYYDTRTNSLNLGWKHDLSDTLSVEGHVFNSHKSFQLRAAISASGLSLLEGGIKEQERGTQWVMQGGQGKAHWLLGWEWRNPLLADTSAHIGTLANPYAIIPLLPQALENGRVINSEFVQLQYAFSDSLELTTGLRHDHYSDFGGHNSPRIAMVQQVGAHDTLKALYSEAYRAPSRGESGVLNSSAIQQNPNLRPETAKTTELIWLHLLNAGVLSTTLFNTQVSDAIIESTVNVPPLKRQPINGQLTVGGLEMEWQYHWNAKWQSRVAVTYIFDPVGPINTQSGTLFGGSLSYEDKAWTATLLANFQGRIRDPNEQDLPANITTTESTNFGGHTLYGAHVSYHVRPTADLFLSVSNLFDKHYLSPAMRPANYIGAPSPGRLVMLGLRWGFE
jgi:outer membrane cobalamin receptor